MGAVAVVVVALAIAFSVWKKGQDQEDANNQLFADPSLLVSNPKLAPPSADGLLKINRDYPGTTAGEAAQLIAAERLFVDGKFEEANTEFSKFITDHPGNPLIAQAQVGVAATLEAQGKTTEAMDKYRDIIAMYAADPNISAPAKLTLARLDEAQNKPEQALSYYTDLARDPSPYDLWATEARERRIFLLAKHPELDKPAPAATAPSEQPTFSITPQATKSGAAPQTPATTPTPPAKTPPTQPHP